MQLDVSSLWKVTGSTRPDSTSLSVRPLSSRPGRFWTTMSDATEEVSHIIATYGAMDNLQRLAGSPANGQQASPARSIARDARAGRQRSAAMACHLVPPARGAPCPAAEGCAPRSARATEAVDFAATPRMRRE